MNKKGQFFLLAAIVIVAILFGLRTVYTTIETITEDNTIYYLTKEVKYEANTVIDSGIFNAVTEEVRNKNLENLTDYYASVNLGTDFIIVYGNKTKMSAFLYKTEDTGSVGIDVGGTSTISYAEDLRKYNATFDIPPGDQEVTIILDKNKNEEIKYTFNIRPGEMFFLVLKKERQGEQFVAASKEQ